MESIHQAVQLCKLAATLYPRFCSHPSRLVSTWVLCRHLSRVWPRGGLWRAGCCPTLPALLRQDSTVSRRAEPTCLAPDCTLAQPAPLLAPLAGSYPALSPLTGGQSRLGGSALCCGCSHDAVARVAPPLAVSWGNRSGGVASSRRESGSSSTGSCRQRRHRCANLVVKLPAGWRTINSVLPSTIGAPTCQIRRGSPVQALGD